MNISVYDQKEIQTSRIVMLLGEVNMVSPLPSLSQDMMEIQPFKDVPAIQLGFNVQDGSARIEGPDNTIIKNITPVKRSAKSAASYPLILSYKTNESIEAGELGQEITRRTLLTAINVIQTQNATILFNKLKSALTALPIYTYVDAFALYAKLNEIRSGVMTTNQDQSMLYYVILPQSLYLFMTAKPAIRPNYMSQADEFMALCNTGNIAIITSSFVDSVMIYDQSKITHYVGVQPQIVVGDPENKGTMISQSVYTIQAGTSDLVAHTEVIGSSFQVDISA